MKRTTYEAIVKAQETLHANRDVLLQAYDAMCTINNLLRHALYEADEENRALTNELMQLNRPVGHLCYSLQEFSDVDLSKAINAVIYKLSEGE